MGEVHSTSLDDNHEKANAAMRTMCQSLKIALLEAVKLKGPLTSEDHVEEVAKTVLEICRDQLKESALELVQLIRRKKREEMGPSSGQSLNDSMLAKLVFLHLLKSAAVLDDTTSGTESCGLEPRGKTISHPWEKQMILGRGGFGCVYSAVDKKGFKFAVKVVPKDGVEESTLKTEMKLLGKLSHKNVIQYYGCAGDHENIYMFIELMQGSIKDQMVDTGKPIPDSKAKNFTKDLLHGLVYLHSKDIIHRDIKCANVLWDQSGTAKLADMGISKMHDGETMVSYASYSRGTIPWMAPEVVSGHHAGKRSDVWSVGCTVYEMIKGTAPFAKEVPGFLFRAILMKYIKNLEHRNLVASDEDLGDTLQNFLLRIFVKMDDRPSAELIAKHPWVH